MARTVLAAILLPIFPISAAMQSDAGSRLARSSVDTVTPVRATADSVVITEWTVPWERSRPRDPFADAKSRVWFVGQTGNYVAYLEPSTGKFHRFQIAQNTLPHNLIVES